VVLKESTITSIKRDYLGTSDFLRNSLRSFGSVHILKENKK
jgi:hypothetical protein